MSKIATNRANIKYAQELRRRGFPTAVHALPEDVKGYVDELLAKGFAIRSLANELNKRYALDIEATGLKPITRTSLTTYRDKYWKKTPAFSRMVLFGNEKTKKDIEKIRRKYDSYKKMVSCAQEGDARYEKVKKLEKKAPLPTRRGDEVLKSRYEMHKDNLEAELLLGIRVKAPTEAFIEHTASVRIQNEKPEDIEQLIKSAKEAIRVFEGKNRPPKITGEWMGSAKPPEWLGQSKKKARQPKKQNQVSTVAKKELTGEKLGEKQAIVKDATAPDEKNEFHPNRRKELCKQSQGSIRIIRN
jgi:hypothetical protein